MGVLWPQLSKVLKPVRWASSVPFPSVPAEAGCLFAVTAGVHLRREPVVVIFLWLFILLFLIDVNNVCL